MNSKCFTYKIKINYVNIVHKDIWFGNTTVLVKQTTRIAVDCQLIMNKQHILATEKANAISFASSIEL